MERRVPGREASLDVDALELLFEQPGIGVCLVGADGRVRRVNDRWLRGTGQPEAVIGARLEDVAPDADDPLRTAWARALAGGRVELPRRRALVDGRETFWAGSAVAVPSPEGRAVLFSIHRVADEEPAAGEPAGLRRSRVLLAAVLENAPTAIAVFGSADRRIRFANRASLALLDVREPGAPVVGRLLSEVVRDPAPLEELVQLVAVSGAPLTDDEYELRLARGITFWRWSLQPLPAPGVEPDVLLIATEITEQVQARRDAEGSARRAAAAEAGAREAAWRIARLQRVTASMSAALTPDDLGRALVGAVLPVTGAAAAAIWALDADGLRSLASTGVPDRSGASVPTPLDAPTPASAATRGREPIFLPAGDEVDARFGETAALRRALGYGALAALPLAVAGRAAGAIVLDWREARPFPPAERELLEAVAAQCAQAVERARLLEGERAVRAAAEVATAEARRTSDLQRQLLAVLGHDLRSPLQAITMGARVLGQRGHLSEKDAATLARVTTAAGRATGILSDLLDLGRARQGLGVRVALAPADLSALVRRVAGELAAEGAGRAPDVVAPASLRGTFDPSRLAQVIRTLAAGARARGGPDVRIQLRVQADPAGARLAVHDDGPAIADSEVPALFEPFGGRTPEPATPLEGGAGLELFVALEIVRAHGGRLEMRSTERDGTTFEIVLPPTPPALEPGPAPG